MEHPVMRILIATNQLKSTGGTECYTYALAKELIKQGHEVEYFTFQKGDVSTRIEKLGVKFRTRIFYDLIIANHYNVVNHLYKRGFIIQTCHGTSMDLEQPSPKANAYVSITQEVHDYLKSKGYISTIIKNGIDCDRFQPQNKLNNHLKTVLSICQSTEANSIIEKACQQQGFHFIKANKFEENCWEIEKIINQADLVIGIGRSIYDAMACGRAVISFDSRPYSSNYGDGYLTEKNISKSILFNCSGRFSKRKFDVDSLVDEMKKYDPTDGQFLRAYALAELNIHCAAQSYLTLYPYTKKNRIKIKKFFTLIIRNTYWFVKILLQKKQCTKFPS